MSKSNSRPARYRVRSVTGFQAGPTGRKETNCASLSGPSLTRNFDCDTKTEEPATTVRPSSEFACPSVVTFSGSSGNHCPWNWTISAGTRK